MRTLDLGNTGLEASAIGLGCMRMSQLERSQAEKLLHTALYEGINFFDHADIYGAGHSEELFAEAIRMSPSIRGKMILQSKCGIKRGSYDFSRDYILQSVDGILKRLKTGYLDILLLHRPDALMEPEEVAEAFDRLQAAGKVRNFGVSNHNPMQIELLSRTVRQKLIVNQLQFSMTNAGMIDVGLNVNTESPLSLMRDGSVLDYCRLKDITIQAWSPFQYGYFQGTFLGNENYPDINRVVRRLAEKYQVTDSAIAIAWILRHPARIQPIVGTTDSERIRAIAKAATFTLTREEWYELYQSAGKKLP